MNRPPQKIAVVGAGIIGAAIAYHLAKDGANVVLIDRTGPGGGASGKSFAWINANDPAPIRYNRFRRDAIAAWRRLETEVRLPMTWGGCLSWERGDNALRDQAAALSADGRDARLVGRDEIAAIAPAIANPPDLALYCPDEGAVDAGDAARALGDAAAAAGATRLIGADVTSLHRDGGRIAGVKTTFGVIEADLTILAAGLGAIPLAAEAGVALPLHAARGLLVRTRPVAPMIAPVILTPEVHFRQQPDGRLIAGEEFSGAGAWRDMIETDPRALAAAVTERLSSVLSGVEVQPDEVILGVRPAPADGEPLIGGTADGLYVAAMHSGVTLAALVGELAAAEVLRGPLAALEPYRPLR